MAKVKYTKNELKTQKDSLKRFRRYLPTLMLKKQQLQMEILRIEVLQNKLVKLHKHLESEMRTWVDVFGEDIEVGEYLRVKELITEAGNVAGIDIPIFKGITFEEFTYDLFMNPLWVDKALEELIKIYEVMAELWVLDRQVELLREELRITSQRVNLFEKVKIPEAVENIRVIQIYLGDQQTAAVVRGKIAKNKIKRQPA